MQDAFVSSVEHRRDVLVSIISQKNSTRKGLKEALKEQGIFASNPTLNRDLSFLIEKGRIERLPLGRATTYRIAPGFNFLHPIDPVSYFSREMDVREIHDRFRFSAIENWVPVFSAVEREELVALTYSYQRKRAKLDPDSIAREMERLVIDFSWKSSVIEGNTYSLLETEALLRSAQEAPGHSREEAQMILNHKDAVSYIKAHTDDFERLELCDIETIHECVTKDLGIPKGLRKRAVRITGTNYIPLENHYQINEALIAVCTLLKNLDDPIERAFAALLLTAYIQPFDDGNKRTSRLVANGLLEANGACMLSYRSMDEVRYKQGMILFYEQNNVSLMKTIFLEQYRFVAGQYF